MSTAATATGAMLDFKKQIAQIGGWLTKDEGEFLYTCARKLRPKAKIVEIGSWKGRSTICLGLGSRDGHGAMVHAVDPHKGSSEHIKLFGKVDTYQEFLDNINRAQVKDFVVPHKLTSEEFAKKFTQKIDFLFIDGAHEYEYVKKDFELWFPKLINGGVVAFHDCWHAPGVQFLTAMILFTSHNICSPKLLDTLTIMKKVQKNSFSDRIWNVGFVIFRLLTGWIGTIKMNYFGGVVLN